MRKAIEKWPLYTGGVGTAAIFSVQASISVSLAHMAIPIFYLFLSPPIRALNNIRVSLTGYRAIGCFPLTIMLFIPCFMPIS